jgi:hypothetical protein
MHKRINLFLERLEVLAALRSETKESVGGHKWHLAFNLDSAC